MLLNCSRQSGKSTIAAILTAHRAYYYPKSLCLLVSSSQRQSSEIFRKVSDTLSRIPSPPKRVEDNRLSLQLENGSRVVSLPGDAGRIRGFSGPDLIVEDEAAQVPDEVFAAIRPMLAVSNGRLLLLSTPFGREGHFYEIWSSDDDSWEKHFITAYECAHIPRDFLETERLTSQEWEFDQEYLGRFVGILHQPFTFQNVVRCLSDQIQPLFLYSEDGKVDGRNPKSPDQPIQQKRELYIGVDLGKEVDYTAISVIEKIGRGEKATYHILHLERLPLGTPYPEIVRYVHSLISVAAIDSKITLVVDKTGVGGPIADYFREENLRPCGLTITSGKNAGGVRGGDWNVPRDDLVTQTQFLVDMSRVRIAKSIPLALDLVEELTHFKPSSNTKAKKASHPFSQRHHDDLAMSAMIPLWYAENGGWVEMEFLAI